MADRPKRTGEKGKEQPPVAGSGALGVDGENLSSSTMVNWEKEHKTKVQHHGHDVRISNVEVGYSLRESTLLERLKQRVLHDKVQAGGADPRCLTVHQENLSGPPRSEDAVGNFYTEVKDALDDAAKRRWNDTITSLQTLLDNGNANLPALHPMLYLPIYIEHAIDLMAKDESAAVEAEKL